MAIIYTDGSCLSPNGPSGWAFCIVEEDDVWCLSDADPSSTNNRMEMMAVIEALKFTKSIECSVYTDSKLVMNCAQGIWKRKSNLDLWKKYNIVSKNKNVKWVWVKAHNGDYYNELVDKLARDEAKNVKKIILRTIKNV